jgi:hypothetical protein
MTGQLTQLTIVPFFQGVSPPYGGASNGGPGGGQWFSYTEVDQTYATPPWAATDTGINVGFQYNNAMHMPPISDFEYHYSYARQSYKGLPAGTSSHVLFSWNYNISAPLTTPTFSVSISPSAGSQGNVLYDMRMNRDITNAYSVGAAIYDTPVGPVQIAVPQVGSVQLAINYDSVANKVYSVLTINGALVYQDAPINASGTGLPFNNSGANPCVEFVASNGGPAGGMNPAVVITNVQVFDATPPVYITLGTITATRLVAPSIGGLDGESPNATGLDYMLDTGAWTTGVASFAAATSNGGSWTGLGPAADSGTHTLTVRNTAVPAIVSNSVTYSIAGTPSSITLGTIAGVVANIPFSIGGIDYEDTPAAALDYQLDSGTWTTSGVGSFAAASARGSLWSGQAPAVGVGTHTLAVRNHSATGIVSNTQTFLVGTPKAPFQGLFQSNVIPGSTDTFTEFGNPMLWNYQTSLGPDNGEIAENAMILTTLEMAFIGASPAVAVTFNDSSGTLLESASVTPSGLVSVWDTMIWDVGVWDGTSQPLSPYEIAWPGPVVFKQGFFQASGTSSQGFRISNTYLQYQVLGYVQQYPSGVQ